MPLYDYKCSGCHSVFETIQKMDAVTISCEVCGSVAKRQIGVGRYHAFPEGWSQNMGTEPVYIKSKKHLKKECDKRGLQSRILD